jgi:hypothetical protein
MRARQGAAIRLARILILALVGSAALQIAVGCAGVGESAAADATPPPLTVYPNQVFSTGKPGQLGLYVEGEDWHVLVDMPGFEHLEEPFTAPTQYLLMRNERTGTLVSVFAERIDGANSDDSCLRHYASATQRARDSTASGVRDKGTVSEVSEIEAHRKTLRVFEYTIPEFGPQKAVFWRKTIYWYPYCRGFCFDFHVTIASAAAQDDVLKVFDSVTYVAHKPVEDIDRLFYFFDWLRIRLRVPIDWQYGYLPPPPGGAGGIGLRPASGLEFFFLVKPLKIPATAQSADAKESLEEVRRWLAARGDSVSPVQKLCSANTCVYYSDLVLSKYDSANPKSFPYGRIGFAQIGDVLLRIDLLYRESSKGTAERFTAALSRVTILDLAAARKAVTQRGGKAAE